MRRIRAGLLGALISVPAALVLPGMTAAQASFTQCPGSINLNQAFSVSVSPAHGNSGDQLQINGSNFPALTNFNSGWNVYFADGSGNQTVHVSTGSVTNSGNTIVLNVPGGAYSGPIEVCLAGDSYQALTNAFARVPVITSVPATATEGSAVTLGGNFVKGQAATVHLSCGNAGVTPGSLSALTFTMPGYCPGQISVSQNAYDGTLLNGPNSSQAIGIQPQAGSPQPSSTTYGGKVTVAGSGFGYGAGSVTVGGAAAGVLSWSDSQVAFQAPDGITSGAIQITDPSGLAAAAGSLTVVPQIVSVQPARATEGSEVTITGHNFGTSGTLSLGGTAVDPSSVAWGTDQVQFLMPDASGTLVLTRGDDGAPAANSGTVSLVPAIQSVSPSSGAPGSLVTISGSGFSQSPNVTIGGKPAQVALPGDTQMAVLVPSGAQSGKLVVTNGYGGSATWGQNFTIIGGSTGSGGGGGGGGGGVTGPIIIQPNYGFLKLPPLPKPITFHITAPSDSVKPGTTVPLTVVLQLNGKPVGGAPIALTLFKSPGKDTALSALSGTTDANGTFLVKLKTSKKAGQTIIVARSGSFGDEITITTVNPTAAIFNGPRTLITNASLDPHVLIPFVGALILAVLLLLGAVILQWRLHRRAAVPVAPAAAAVAVAEPVPAAPKRPRRPRQPKPPAEPEAQAQPAAAAEPLAQAVGAEDLVAPSAEDALAPVIPLRKPRAARAVQVEQARRRQPAPKADGRPISKTRARKKPSE